MNFVIQEIDKQECIDFVHKNHYSKVMPRLTKHYLGSYINNKLVAVMTLGWGTQPKGTINKLFNGLDSSSYYEIGKMCLLDELPRNTETQFIAEVIKWIKINLPEKLFLYTLADGIMGKAGYVYQAANFLYGGNFKTLVYRTKYGEKVHPRTASDLCKENAEFLGKEKVFWLTPEFLEYKELEKIQGLMFRYIYPLNKKAKKLLKSSSVEWTLEHPKDKDLIFKKQIARGKYIEVPQPEFNKFNYQYNKQKEIYVN
jgi:hypothetical protein